MSEIDSCTLRYKRYPDRDDYINVARSIIAKYPFFKPKDGNPCVSYPICTFDVIVTFSLSRMLLSEP